MDLSYWVETLGCSKNKVDSEKLEGRLVSQGFVSAGDAENADLVVVNTCAFIEAARMESIETVLDFVAIKKPGARIVITGCMAERYGEELAKELPEVDLVARFGQELSEFQSGPLQSVPVAVSAKPRKPQGVRDFDLLNLRRPAVKGSWAYLKIAEGCDRACGFCAIPSFRGKQQSRSIESIVEEAKGLGTREVVLIAQDLASYGTDIYGKKYLADLIKELSKYIDWVRILYIYPSELTDALIETVLATGVAYFDLSLQHSSRRLLRKMRRWGSGERFLEKIGKIRSIEPNAAFRSSFIIGYPGETEEDHDNLLQFIEDAQLDWAGFFTFSDEEGTYANTLEGKVDPFLVMERLAEVSELQDSVTQKKRVQLIGGVVKALVDEPGVARSFREAPEIDGIIKLDDKIPAGKFVDLVICGSEGPDLFGELAG
ncbi:MAG: 30S ribosomal protein S12 methylthiotransferase RimO [Acidimicrobiaceae bacterium]|nr:30S ribosomal protein S12 methylthiotransferase RimO [Acidimicrobiaceae bacterium]